MSIRNSVVNGIVWTFLGTVGAGVFNFAITVILARLLTPADFGLMELLIIFTSVSTVFVDSGFSKAVIRDNDAKSIDKSSVFYMNMGISIILYTLLFFCAPLIANYFDSQELISLSRVVFLTIIINSLALIQIINFEQEIKFKPQAIASIVSMIVSGTVSITMAYMGYGVWALAMNMLLYSLFKTLLLWIQSKWVPKFEFSKESIKKYIGIGGNLLIQNIVDRVVTNLESFAIGRVFTKSDLGYFSQARKFDSLILQVTTAAIQKVTYPALAQIRDDSERLREGYRRVISVSMFCIVPIMFFISANAENVLAFIFGKQWIPAAPYMRIWAIVGLLISFYTIFFNVFIVTGKLKLLMKLSMTRQAIRIIAVLVLIKVSILALLYGILAVAIISTIAYTYFAGKLINYSFKTLWDDLWQIVFCATVSAFIAFLAGIHIPTQSIIIETISQVLIMFLSYALLLFMFRNKTLKEMFSILTSIIKRK